MTKLTELIARVEEDYDFADFAVWQDIREEVQALLDPETGEPLHFETPPCPVCGEHTLGTATQADGPSELMCVSCGTRFVPRV